MAVEDTKETEMKEYIKIKFNEKDKGESTVDFSDEFPIQGDKNSQIDANIY
jgi:hypothetical protein